MKQLNLLILALAASFALQAQWVDDPATNNFIANCGNDDGEIYTATNPVTGDTYIQWVSGAPNGWAPWLQRLTFDGTPQWGRDGIHITTPNLASWSPGYAMAATTDGAVVSMFRTADAHHYAVRINPDGTYPWGEYGIMLFDGMGGDRSEVIAGNDGGIWALGCDYDNSYLQYIQADGTMGPIVTVNDPGGYNCMFGQLTLSHNNNVLFTFEKVGSGYYTDKQIYVMAVSPEGEIIGSENLLMSSQTFQSTYIHHAVPDGMGGGYAYIWHPGIGGAFNTYVFHFNEFGNPTISDQNGIPVHSADPTHYYGNAYATADPVTCDLIVAYEQTDASSQSQSRIYVNRITATGERVWDEGIMVADYEGLSYSDIMVDAFEDGSGFSVIYTKSSSSNPYFTTIEAIGMDMNGNQLWNKTLCSNAYRRTVCNNSTGFHLGQNIVAWVNCLNGGIYAQNIGPDGTMGPIEPPVITCLAPENFEGEYIYDMDEQQFGVKLSWIAPETLPLHYNLYRTEISTKETIIIELESTVTSYYDGTGMGDFMYQLTAVYENCESDFALTPNGEDNVHIIVTNIQENADNSTVTVLRIFNANGQVLNHKSLDELGTGIYILQGLTEDGRLVSRKIVVNK
jgi:hypothetical protein